MKRYRKSQILGPNGRQMVVVNSAYEAAGQGRRATKWHAPGGGPNALLTGGLSTLRNRSRAGQRNNPWVSIGIDRLASNEVGTGITPRSKSSDEDFREAANAAWALSANELDADGVLNVYGQQALISRNRNMSGEVFIRRRPRRLDSGLAVPLQIQVLEAEFVPETLNQTQPNGNIITAGIEFNRSGRRVAYWMYPQHPGEYTNRFNMGRLLRIPAANVIHHYLPFRPGQIRAEPVTVQSLLKAHSFDSYDDAELERKRTRAPFTGAVKKPEIEFAEDDWQYNPITGEPIVEDAEGVPTMDAEAGTFLNMLPGEEIQLFSGDDTGQGYADFMRQQLLAIAAGFGVPYEMLTGDWSKVNDRLVRAMMQEFRRPIQMMQNHLMIYQVCLRMWAWWIDAAVFSGRLTAVDYESNRADYQKCEWRPQPWPYLHPEQDVNAKNKRIQAGLSSRQIEVDGADIESIDEANREDKKRAESFGLQYTVYQADEASDEPSNRANDNE